jgi:hypothetical protein
MALTGQDTLRQTIEQTMHKFLHAFVDVSNANDARLIPSMLDPSCTRLIRPTSLLTRLGAPVDFAFDVAMYEKTIAGGMTAFRSKSVEIADVVIDSIAKNAAASTVNVNQLTDGREFPLQFSWHVSFTEDGTKVTKIIQWCDAIGFPAFQAAVAEASLSGAAETV